MILDVQYSSACNDWPTLRRAAQQAEADGFDTAWVFDHFDGSTLGGDRPVLEAFTLLGAMAATTSTIGLGTLVANVANRHPALLAHAAHAVHEISGRRLRLGIGAGTAPGTPWAAEHDRRGIALSSSIEARHHAVETAIRAIREATDAPIIVGTNSISLAILAGRLADGVNVRLEHPRAAELCDAARSAAEGRPFELSAYSTGPRQQAEAAARDLGVARLVFTSLDPL